MARPAAGESQTASTPKHRASPRDVPRRAVAELRQLVNRDIVGVASMEPTDDGWQVEVEVLELERVPDTTSVLGTYQVDLDESGELLGYRRLRRYTRSSTEDA
jgi:hypothetical protein